MFSGSGNTQRLLGTLSDVCVCRNSKMTAGITGRIGNYLVFNNNLWTKLSYAIPNGV